MTIAETPARNGVDTASLFATIDAVAGQRDLARFQFRATNRWMNGTHSRSSISTFRGAGQEQSHVSTWEFDADHPMVLTGKDGGPTPVEFVLVALASCLTAGIANIASARGVTLDSVESNVEGDIDLQGILGLSPDVRNGYENIRVSFHITADAPEAKIRSIVEQSRARSAVFDIITGSVPVDVDVTVG